MMIATTMLRWTMVAMWGAGDRTLLVEGRLKRVVGGYVARDDREDWEVKDR